MPDVTFTPAGPAAPPAAPTQPPAPPPAPPAETEAPKPKARPKTKGKPSPPDFVVVSAGFGVWVKGDLLRESDLPEGCNLDRHLEAGALAPYVAPESAE